jgi:hypothetical protein
MTRRWSKSKSSANFPRPINRDEDNFDDGSPKI